MSKALNKNNFFALAFFFYFLLGGASVASAGIGFTAQEEYPYLFLYPQISLSNQREIEDALLHGVDYHILLQWTIAKKNSSWFLPYIVVEEEKFFFTLFYDNVNRSFVVRQDTTVTPFEDFSSALSHVLSSFFTISMLGKESGRYKLRLRAEGSAIRFFFPLNIIYKTFMDSLGFHKVSVWQTFIWEKK